MERISPALMSAPPRWTTRAVEAAAAALVICVLLNAVELARSGTDAAQWGVLADLSEAVVPLLAAYLLARLDEWWAQNGAR